MKIVFSLEWFPDEILNHPKTKLFFTYRISSYSFLTRWGNLFKGGNYMRKYSMLKIIWFLGYSKFHLEIIQVKNLSSLFSNFQRTSLKMYLKYSALIVQKSFLWQDFEKFLVIHMSRTTKPDDLIAFFFSIRLHLRH